MTAAVSEAIQNQLVSNLGALGSLLAAKKLPVAMGVLDGPHATALLTVTITLNQAGSVTRVGPRLVLEAQQGMLAAYLNTRGIACDSATVTGSLPALPWLSAWVAGVHDDG